MKIVLFFLGLAAATLGAFAAEHPSLVSVESADCKECHDELLGGRSWTHAPAEEDCTICHEFSVAEEGTTVGLLEAEPGLCLLCHDEKTAAVEADLDTPHFPVTESCLTCHDPHGSDQARPVLAPLIELCGECHDLGDLQHRHGQQLTAVTDCARCHEPHGSDNARMLVGAVQHRPFAEGSCEACHRPPFGERMRLRARGERLCAACHGELVEPSALSTHPALRGDGRRAGCLSCHNPHMSDQARLLEAEGPGLCVPCHEAIVALATGDGGHYPAAEDCLNCHQPHASENTLLLAIPLGELCSDCHDTDDAALAATHLGADLTRLTCTDCHTPHGSTHWSLLADNLHPPLEDGCDLCHTGAFNELEEGGGNELCLLCHDDVGEAAAAAAFAHEALELGECRDCHNPHASPQQRLIKSPGAGPCAECHDEQAAGDGEVAHGVIDLLGCRACHEPHGGERDLLLRDEPTRLCLSCHGGALEVDAGAETVRLLDHFDVPTLAAQSIVRLRLSADGRRDHPVAGHRVLGTPSAEELKRVDTSFTEELTCLTCHDPHKGRSRQLLRWNAEFVDEACSACHSK
ncbi:MAG: cytochrome c3 family protein [Acidobacteriota bacterium]|nr:cytochrome c3 family protein [Acidobacteriota bacterium]